MLCQGDVPVAPAPTKRPRYLLLALIALALIGLTLSGEGYQLMRASTDPAFIAAETADLESVVQAAVRAQLEAVAEHRRWLLPLGIAELVLGGVLVIIAVRALGRRASLRTLTQFTVANLVVCLVGYILAAPVRAQVITTLVALPDPIAAPIARFMPVVFALRVGVPALTLALCWFAITRPRARDFMRLTEQAHEER